MRTGSSSYQDILKSELAKRCEVNPKYSLRAFARDLKLSPSRLSQILNHKLGLSEAAAQNLTRRLGMNAKEARLFCHLVQASDARSKDLRKSGATVIQQMQEDQESYREIHVDAFCAISDWHHYGLIELLKTKGLKQERKWLSNRLGISVYELDLTVERLKRLGLVRESKGKLSPTEEKFTAGSEVPSVAIRNFHKQILSKAMAAVELQSIDERDFSAVTGAICEKDVPKYAKLIKQFRRDINTLFEKGRAQSDQVYCMSIQFFRLTERVEGR